MSDAGIPLKVIATYSGHRDLAQLNAYLEVKDSQILGAAASLSMLSPVLGDVGIVADVGKPKNTKLVLPWDWDWAVHFRWEQMSLFFLN